MEMLTHSNFKSNLHFCFLNSELKSKTPLHESECVDVVCVVCVCVSVDGVDVRVAKSMVDKPRVLLL